MLFAAGALALLLQGEPSACEDSTPGPVIESEHVPDDYARWVRAARHRIHAKWKVPRSVRAGEVGTVVLRFVVGEHGKVRELETVCATGDRSLEKASRRAIKAASPLEELPEDAGHDSVTVRWRFHYDWRKSVRDDEEYPEQRWVR